MADRPETAPGAPQRSAEQTQKRSPRWLVLLAWSTGLAGLYTLLGLAHAGIVEGVLSEDIGFGRSLAFWVGTVYLALLGWAFLPAQPSGRAAGRLPVLSMLALGALATVVCVAFAALWLAAHWSPGVGGPVTASIIVLLAAGTGVLWLAQREDRHRTPAE
ncbi:MAG: hypothetical protein AB7K36_21260 [Chloroflexota bacterium]